MTRTDLLKVFEFPVKGFRIQRSLPFWKSLNLFENLEGKLVVVNKTMVLSQTTFAGPPPVPAPTSLSYNEAEDSCSDTEETRTLPEGYDDDDDENYELSTLEGEDMRSIDPISSNNNNYQRKSNFFLKPKNKFNDDISVASQSTPRPTMLLRSKSFGGL